MHANGSDRLKIILAFLAVSTIWGSTWLAIKLGLKTVPPFLSAGLRFVLASTILLTIVRVREGSIPKTREARIVYASMGLLSFTIPFALVYWGTQFIPSALGSILFAAYPFWVALFSILLLPNERMNAYKAAGIAIGFIGLVVVFSRDLEWTGSSSLSGHGSGHCQRRAPGILPDRREEVRPADQSLRDERHRHGDRGGGAADARAAVRAGRRRGLDLPGRPFDRLSRAVRVGRDVRLVLLAPEAHRRGATSR